MTTSSESVGAAGPQSPADSAEYTCARFWKCALQVNPEHYAKKYRGQDHGLTGDAFLAALLKECQEQDIRLIGLASHGDVADVDATRAYLAPHGIVVLPGFEICTTEKIHWVCLFPESTTVELLTRYLGALDLLDPADGVRPSRLGGEQLLAKVEELGGFCYAAHVTDPKGLLTQKANHLWQDPRLKAAQIRETGAKVPQPYKQIVANTDPAYKREQPIALINATDVEKPERLSDPRASCFIKMTRPGFDALCTAFKDPGSRVRLHDDMVATDYSRIERLQIDGGYLRGTDIRFSPHLNTVIGGRGAGKSTLIECLRYALGKEHKTAEARKQGDSVVKENLGKAGGRIEVTLVSAHQNMLRYRVVRRYGEPVRVIDANGDESALTIDDLLPGIEIYGQNEIYDIARDEDALIRVLDRYLPDQRRHADTVALLQRKLKTNADRLHTAEEQRDELLKQVQRLPGLEEQARQFSAIGLDEKLKLVPLLEKERQMPARMTEEVDRLAVGLETLRDSLPDTAFLSDQSLAGLPHADIVIRSRAALQRVKVSVEAHLTSATGEVDAVRAEVATAVTDLDRERRAAEDAIEKEFATLPSMAGKDGPTVGRAYQALQRDIETVRPLQARIGTVTDLVNTLQQERRNLLGELSDLRNSRTRALENEVDRLNKKLAGKLRLHIEPNGNRKTLKEFLGRLPGMGEKSTGWVDTAGDLTIPALVDACRAGSSALLAKQWGVTAAKAETICTKLARADLSALETVDLEDRVRLELNVAHEGVSYKPLERLSTGQQCTAILHLLLLDNPDPLVMDQPEDNLDNAFIADRIVQELRTAKTARQFFFATHNANIPVFGDAEWIGVFEATEDRGSIPPENQGSVDVPRIRDAAARILDGGREAFLQRQQKYGY